MLCRATIYGTYGGMGHINVLHFEKAGNSFLDYTVLGQKVEDFWVGAHKGNTQSHMQWNRVHVQDLSNTFDAYDHPMTVQGVLGFTSQYIPFLCAVFKFATHTAGRHGRGRSSQGGYDNSAQFNAGLWNSTMQTRLDNVADALQTDWANGGSINTGGWGLVVCPRTATVSDEAHPVISIIASSKIGTINTRKIGRGL